MDELGRRLTFSLPAAYPCARRYHANKLQLRGSGLRYFFESCSFDTGQRELRRGSDVIAVAPQVFDLLEYLICNRQRVVSKDDLIDAIWHGRAVSDVALTTRLNAVRKAIGDSGDEQRLIRTFRHKGVRFIAAVREAPDRKAPTIASDLLRPAQDKPSLVVLPFVNLSPDPEQDYFVDGVTESLTTDLSRVAGIFVIGRNTALTFKGKHVDLKQIGLDLGVRYVLEGAVQLGRSRMRISCQLIDTDTGNHVWAERFDKPIADLFHMQDEIGARLANELGTELVSAEARRAARAPDVNSMDLYFQGMASVNRGSAPENLAQARHFFEQALDCDPTNLDAMVGMAFVDTTRATSMLIDRMAPLRVVETSLARILAQLPNHAMSHCLMGVVQIFTKRAAQGIAECERSLALDRNLAAAHAWIGLGKCNLGHAEETEACVMESFRLSPRDNRAFSWMNTAGVAQSYLGADQAAVHWFKRSIQTNRNIAPFVHFYLAAALAHLGELDEARTHLQEGLTIIPNFSIDQFHASSPSDHPTCLAQRTRIAEGLRKAGLCES